MRRILLASTAIVLTAIGAALWLVPGGERPSAPVVAVPPPLPPPPIVAAVLKGGPGGLLPVADPDALTLSEEGVKALTDFARRSHSQALLVWQAGALQLEYYDPALQPGDRLDAAGLLPGLLALLTGIALQDGTLAGIDDPISRYLPEWAGDARGRITVRHLLEGSSGLTPPATPPGDDASVWTLSAELAVEPGTRFAPNSYEAQLLGLVLSRARNQPVADYLATALWQPLGARDASLEAGSKTGAAYLQCCMKATARDWLRPGLLLLEDGRVGADTLVPKPWLDLMLRPNGHSRNDGWRLRLGWPFDPKGPVAAKAPFTDGDTVFMAGDDGSRLYISKARELVILRLGALGADWDESTLPNLVSRASTLVAAEPRSVNGKKVQKANDLNGKVAMPPITKPPPIPKVTVEPLEDGAHSNMAPKDRPLTNVPAPDLPPTPKP
ncbi:MULTISPECIES: serine hydrolase [unclassified Azospirillum]|uniref:serine hydrolase domain-containing protein n=1 Tax=unclassified Azospirillum TaxID=2630922 RepID=UPI000B751044|nr:MULTISPECIES: serine hydrolase [unclassified Azospirillum]SNS38215.1 CubicO group peptidase, beta-lactamase class C family [Azospirillum sp. RU38E]SNS56807.1 CubicO group peptidase, beta-lactamase class C family [Azospirillum sp. RU37A]